MSRPSMPPLREFAGEDDRVLDELLSLDAAGRRARLDAYAARDAALAARLAPFVAELDTADGFLPVGGAAHGRLFEAFCDEIAHAPEEPAALEPGDTVGAYRILERVGRGGMGEVYRARDEQLGRDVALKVLSASLRADPSRVERLKTEARVLAALNHPNVAAIYGIASHGDASALVLEFVRGATLAQRLRDGALPLTDVVSAARQLVDALGAAHARGVVHCDLKPSNVVISRRGRVKVLDFGIATVLRETVGDESGALPLPVTSLDAPGLIAGTSAYMSPEQVRGIGIDHRADVWAFGCVLFEMLTGLRAFDGTTTNEVLSQVLDRPPDLDRLPPSTPAPLRELVARCLRKKADDRLATIADARPFLDAADPASNEPELAGASRTRHARVWAILAAALVTGAAVLAALAWTLTGRAAEPVARLTVPLPASDELVTGAQPAIAITPDGRTLVYRARRDGEIQLFQRSLDALEPTPLPGTTNASGVFVSPDGEWVGFDQDGVLMRVSLRGGAPQRIAATGAGGSAGAWGEHGEIVFAPTPGPGLYRVPAAGGTPVQLTRADTAAGVDHHAFPEILPGGRHAIFTLGRRDGPRIAAVDLSTGTVATLAEGRQARYLPPDHLAIARGDTLWVVPFDPRRAEVTGPGAAVLRGLDTTNSAQFAVTAAGSLLYVPARDLVPPRSLVWIDRRGREQPATPARRRYVRSSLSPDGTRVAVTIADGGTQNVWVQDLRSGDSRQLTSSSEIDTAPLWTPDGRAIVFRSEREGGGLFLVPADGSAPPRRLTPADGRLHTPYAFTRDGRTLLVTEFRSYRDQGIGALSLDSGSPVRIVLDEPHAELRPALSPDGRWLAYQADNTGRFEVYVGAWPDPASRRWQASAGGGTSPQWSPDGRELFYYDGQSMVRVPIASSGDHAAGAPQRLFDASPFAGRLGPVYSVAPDGRFLVIKEEPERDTVAARRHLLLVQNWATEVRAALAHAGSK